MAVLSGRKTKAMARTTGGPPEEVADWLLRDVWPGRGVGQDMRDAWQRFERQLLAEWIKDNPGTRPPTWWEWMAPEPRAVKPSKLYYVRECRPDRRGLPLLFSTKPNQLNYWGRLTVESGAGYLRRLKLLLPGEAKRLRESDYRQQTIDLSVS